MSKAVPKPSEFTAEDEQKLQDLRALVESLETRKQASAEWHIQILADALCDHTDLTATESDHVAMRLAGEAKLFTELLRPLL